MMSQCNLMTIETAQQIKRCSISHMTLCQERILTQNVMVMWLLFVLAASVALSTDYHVSPSALNFGSSIYNENCNELSV